MPAHCTIMPTQAFILENNTANIYARQLITMEHGASEKSPKYQQTGKHAKSKTPC
jgi:hypothetical protein